MKRWVEHDVIDYGVAWPSSQRLQSLATIGAKDLNNSAFLRGRCDQGPVRVDAKSAQFCLMRLNDTVHAVFSHVIENFDWATRGIR